MMKIKELRRRPTGSETQWLVNDLDLISLKSVSRVT